MIAHRETRKVAYPAALMFAVVADVEKYPEFLPWVVSLRVLSRRENGLTAEMAVGYGALRERYISDVTLDPVRQCVDVVHIQDRKKASLFKTLENHWRFTPEGEACRVDFEIDFEFKSRVLTALLSANFHYAVHRLVGCFEARARALYGKA